MSTLADQFRTLHQQAGLLRLPNAWDAGSALQLQALGAQAVATTSAGVAWSLGYPDGNALPLEHYLFQAARISRVLSVPFSADIEGGYADAPEEAGDNVARFIGLGVVGINIEDGVEDPDRLARKIEAIRAAAGREGVPLFINARTDVYVRRLAPEGARAADVITRSRLYQAAGADSIFPIGLTHADEIRDIVAGSPLPVALGAAKGQPPADELAALGVKRLSMGSLLPQTLWAHSARLVSGFLAEGCSDPLVEDAAAYADVNAAFRAHRS